MSFLINLSQEILVIVFIIVIHVIIYGIPAFVIYKLVKRLIRYAIDYKYRRDVYDQAQEELNQIEDELNGKTRF